MASLASVRIDFNSAPGGNPRMSAYRPTLDDTAASGSEHCTSSRTLLSVHDTHRLNYVLLVDTN